MFDWAAVNILKYEWIVNPKKQKWTIDESDQEIQEVMSNLHEKYEELAEEFIDDIFEFEGKLERTEWERLVVKNKSYIFNPSDIRDKLKSAIKEFDDINKSRVDQSADVGLIQKNENTDKLQV